MQSANLIENILNLHCLYSTTDQAISGILRDSSWPRFFCPCVAGISLVSHHQTKARKAAKKLHAAPHYDARQMMTRSRYICISTDSKKKLEIKLSPPSEEQSSGKQEIPFHYFLSFLPF